VNVFPSEIEAVVLDDPALGGQYAIVVDQRGAMPELELHAELAPEASRADCLPQLEARLEQRLRIRIEVLLGGPGAIPRQEVGKARRVFERTAEHDPFPRPLDG
jgi:phenylacetate-CoA ligase